MQRNTSVTLGEHFNTFVNSKIEEGRFETASEAVRAGLRLLELEETKLELLRTRLNEGEEQLNKGEAIDGESFMNELIS